LAFVKGLAMVFYRAILIPLQHWTTRGALLSAEEHEDEMTRGLWEFGHKVSQLWCHVIKSDY